MTDNKQCETCHIGTLHAMQATYTSWIDDQLIIVPNIEAWLCDVCADFWHEPDAIARIEMLLGSKQVPSHLNQAVPGGADRPTRPLSSPDRTRSV